MVHNSMSNLQMICILYVQFGLCIMFFATYLMRMLDFRCSMVGSSCRTQEWLMLDVGCSMVEFSCSMVESSCSMVRSSCKMLEWQVLDVRFNMVGSSCRTHEWWMLDIRVLALSLFVDLLVLAWVPSQDCSFWRLSIPVTVYSR